MRQYSIRKTNVHDSMMKDTDLQAIRASLHKGWALGDGRFREEIALQSERRAAPLRKGRPRKNKG